MDAIEALLSRSSATRLSHPGPTDLAIEQIIQSAMCAPDHGQLKPWKFIIIREAMLAKFGDVLADALKRRRPNVPMNALQLERNKAIRAPLIIVVAHHLRVSARIPAVEQLLSAGAAAQNIMLATYALGYGAMWKTGDAAYDGAIKRALGLEPADSIIGFIYVGTAIGAKTRRRLSRGEIEELVQDWKLPTGDV